MTMTVPCQHFHLNILYLLNKHARQSSQAFCANKEIKREDDAEERNTLPFRESILHFSIFQSSSILNILSPFPGSAWSGVK